MARFENPLLQVRNKKPFTLKNAPQSPGILLNFSCGKQSHIFRIPEPLNLEEVLATGYQQDQNDWRTIRPHQKKHKKYLTQLLNVTIYKLPVTVGLRGYPNGIVEESKPPSVWQISTLAEKFSLMLLKGKKLALVLEQWEFSIDF